MLLNWKNKKACIQNYCTIRYEYTYIQIDFIPSIPSLIISYDPLSQSFSINHTHPQFNVTRWSTHNIFQKFFKISLTKFNINPNISYLISDYLNVVSKYIYLAAFEGFLTFGIPMKVFEKLYLLILNTYKSITVRNFHTIQHFHTHIKKCDNCRFSNTFALNFEVIPQNV